MGKLIVQQWISLDGFASDRNGQLDFFASTVQEIYNDQYYKSYLGSFDSILLGRRTYEQFVAVWPNRKTDGNFLATKINTGNKIVFSNTLTEAPWGKWNAATIETGDPALSIRSLKASPGHPMVLWGSLSLAQLAMQENLVDEYHLHICPALTGGGRKLIPDGLNPAELRLVDSRNHDNGVVSVHYSIQQTHTNI